MGLLFAARDRLRGVADRAELLQLQTEVRETVAQLRNIRRDALEGMQILPDPALSTATQHLEHQMPAHLQPTTHSTVHEPEDSQVFLGLTQPDRYQHGQRLAAQGGIPAADSARPTQAERRRQAQGLGADSDGGVSTAGAEAWQLGRNLDNNRNHRAPLGQSEEMRGGDGQKEGPQLPLPISAKAAGLIARRRGAPFGAQVLSDALLEERVARAASKYVVQNQFVVRGGHEKV